MLLNRAVQRVFVSLLESGSKVMLLDLSFILLIFLCPLSFIDLMKFVFVSSWSILQPILIGIHESI